MLLHIKYLEAMAAVRDCGFELVDHHPYSPDLAPSDYFLFSNMNKHLAWKQYDRTDDEVIILQLRTFSRIWMRYLQLN